LRESGEKGAKSFSGDLKIASAVLRDAKEIYAKNLGPQFSYRGVFLIEYGGPIAIMLAFSLRPAFLFGAGSQPLRFFEALTSANFSAPVGSARWNSFVQALGVSMWLAHFVKRELETYVPQESWDAH
jgi:very-long-chain enoyl-CoA reductase